MILADTSAWVEFLRDTGSVAHRCVRAALADRDFNMIARHSPLRTIPAL